MTKKGVSIVGNLSGNGLVNLQDRAITRLKRNACSSSRDHQLLIYISLKSNLSPLKSLRFSAFFHRFSGKAQMRLNAYRPIGPLSRLSGNCREFIVTHTNLLMEGTY